MKKIDLFFKKTWVKVILTIVLTIIPAYDFYSNLLKTVFDLMNITSNANLPEINLLNSIPNIITGILIAGMFLLYLKSRNEFIRVKSENKRIREMLLTIHLFDNIRFSKIKDKLLPDLFTNEEALLKNDVKRVFKLDLGIEYTESDIKEILDTFYRKKPKFIEVDKKSK